MVVENKDDYLEGWMQNTCCHRRGRSAAILDVIDDNDKNDGDNVPSSSPNTQTSLQCRMPPLTANTDTSILSTTSRMIIPMDQPTSQPRAFLSHCSRTHIQRGLSASAFSLLHQAASRDLSSVFSDVNLTQLGVQYDGNNVHGGSTVSLHYIVGGSHRLSGRFPAV
jgi:hypothetical protein